MSHALLIDLTECVGCHACTEACQIIHSFPEEEPKNLDYQNFTKLDTIETADDEELYVRRLCRHCVEPACESVCIVGALVKTDDGAVKYDAYKCIGCRYCMLACPFDIPKYEWHSLAPKVRKCTLCYQERCVLPDFEADAEGLLVDANGEEVIVDEKRINSEERDRLVELTTNDDDERASACSVACPTAATLFGDRDEMLEEAKRRLSENPDQYVQRIYGQKEVGGTNVLYLSSVPFEDLGFSTTVGNESLPDLTWDVLKKIPDLVVTAGVAFGAIYWITNRREEVRKYENDVKNGVITQKQQETSK